MVTMPVRVHTNNNWKCSILAAAARKAAREPFAVRSAFKIWNSAMTEHSLWRVSRALHAAITEGETDLLESVLDDDVDWAIYGPIDMFPFLGTRRGKRAVIDVCRQIAKHIRVRRLDREAVMLGEDQAASLVRYSLTSADSSKSISVRAAHFAQFKRGRLSCLRVLLDTFDLVEQALGHSIHLPAAI